MSKEKFELYEFEAGNSHIAGLEDPIQCTLNNCTFSAGFMNFTPTLPINALFLVIFGIFIFPQLYFGIKHRTIGFTTTMLIGLALEVLGCGGEIQRFFGPDTLPPALIGQAIGPVFIAGAVYYSLSHVTCVYDPDKKILIVRTRIYRWVFWISSFIGLVMQVIGSLLAGFAENQRRLRVGAVVLAAGYLTQIPPLLLSCILCLRFYWSIKRFCSVRDNRCLANIKRFLSALFFAGIFIIVRCIFRVIQLSLPFQNVIAQHEAFTVGFDTIIMVLVCIILTFMHPGIALAKAYQESKLIVRSKAESVKEQTSGDYKSDI